MLYVTLTEKTPILWEFTLKDECLHSNSNVNTHISVLTLIIGSTLSFFKCVHSKLGVHVQLLRAYAQHWVCMLNS